MQSRDLDLEVDEIKKAVQHEVWSFFQVWHPRSTFHLTVEVLTPEHSRSIAQQLAYDTTIDEVLQLLPPRRSCLHFVVMPNDLWYSQSAHSLKATRWTVPPWLWLRISMWRFSHCCNKVAQTVTGREEACLCRIWDCWEDQITLPSSKDVCCRYCCAARCDMKADINYQFTLWHWFWVCQVSSGSTHRRCRCLDCCSVNLCKNVKYTF